MEDLHLQACYKKWLSGVDRQARLKGVTRQEIIQAVRLLHDGDGGPFSNGVNLFSLDLGGFLKMSEAAPSNETKVTLQVVADIIDRSTNGNEIHVWLNAPWNSLLGKEKVWLPASVVPLF